MTNFQEIGMLMLFLLTFLSWGLYESKRKIGYHTEWRNDFRIVDIDIEELMHKGNHYSNEIYKEGDSVYAKEVIVVDDIKMTHVSLMPAGDLEVGGFVKTYVESFPAYQKPMVFDPKRRFHIPVEVMKTIALNRKIREAQQSIIEGL